MKKLSLSIITINRNNAKGLQKTLNSVYAQSFSDFEHIIIDGNSTDQSLEVIKAYRGKLSYWISEPDNGIYQAMNKGILQASGEYCFFLNSGDILYNTTVLDEINKLELTDDFVCFDSIVDSGKEKELVSAQKEITFYFLYTHTIVHQSMLIKRSLFQKYGLYNERFKIAADWEFTIKAIFLYQAGFKSFPLVISIFDATGISSNTANYPIAGQERKETLEKYFRIFLPDYELIKDKAIYTFLNHLSRRKLIRDLYIFKLRIINKILKLLKHNKN